MRQHQYVMTLHAEEEMTDDGLSVFDAYLFLTLRRSLLREPFWNGRKIRTQRPENIGLMAEHLREMLPKSLLD